MWGAKKLKTTPTFWLRQLDSVINQNRKRKKKHAGSRTGLRRIETHTLESMVCPGASGVRLARHLAVIGLEDGSTRHKKHIQSTLEVTGSLNSP